MTSSSRSPSPSLSAAPVGLTSQNKPRSLSGTWRRYLSMSLFWRTFLLLSLMLGAGILGWIYTLRYLELEPRGVQSAQQIASLVNLSRSALRYQDQLNRVALVKSMGEQNSVRIQPREPGDRYVPFEVDRFTRAIGGELRSQLGPNTILASSVNQSPGLWVGFKIESDDYWLQTDQNRIQPAVTGKTYFAVIGLTLVLTLSGSALIAGLINRPLRQLSAASTRIREGDLDFRLDEGTTTREIREVNRGFNRMARELAKIDDDRAVMLAGISHDLRTPLARIRLETEMSVADEEARRNMADDIDQLDAIIDKFMDYARPTEVKLVPVVLAVLLDTVIRRICNDQLKIIARVTTEVRVLADETDLDRVFANLFENARRYAQSPDGVARVTVTCARTPEWVMINVRDEGPGVNPANLARLTTPFFRGDKARTHTSSTGAGLGLAIVDKTVTRMGGQFDLANAPGGGLVASIRLRRAV